MRPDHHPADPFLKGRLGLYWAGLQLQFLVPHSVFSSQRIDAGTRLLLDRLPPGRPRDFLDLGCGYGALGLPVAARFPDSRGVLVDRDLLAVEYSRRNAVRLGIDNVQVVPSLGTTGLGADLAFDWILLNFPARAGERVLRHFLEAGLRRLREGGELRAVVISPLAAMVEKTGGAAGLSWTRVASTEQHAVFAFPAVGRPGPDEGGGDGVYERDEIELSLPEKIRLARPTDLADEPHRLETAVPLLAGHLPGDAPARVLAFRAGYGLLPALVLARYPRASVVAVDRDLLAVAYSRRNLAAQEGRVRVEACLETSSAAPWGPYDLIVGELSSPVGRDATVLELSQAKASLSPHGRALVLGLLKQWKEYLSPASAQLGLKLVESRGPVALLELRAGT